MSVEEFKGWLLSNVSNFKLIGTKALAKAGVKVTPSDRDVLVRMSDIPLGCLGCIIELAVKEEEEAKYKWTYAVIKLGRIDFIICDDVVYDAKAMAHDSVLAYAMSCETARIRLEDKQFRYGFASAVIFSKLREVF